MWLEEYVNYSKGFSKDCGFDSFWIKYIQVEFDNVFEIKIIAMRII